MFSINSVKAVIVLCAIGLIFAISGCDKSPADESQQNSAEPNQYSTSKAALPVPAKITISLNNVVRYARTWGPVQKAWYGQLAPDFTVIDINGQTHQLSSYKGKDVIIIFWATWCGPCRTEIPHLKELRNTISENDLAMLAISDENPEKVKKFAENYNLNYNIISTNIRAMPAPYSRLTALPTSIYIDKQGKIKIITEGAISLTEIKAVINSQWD